MNWVVTSAHCRQDNAIHRVLMYYDYSRNYSHTYTILFWRIHEKYDIKKPTVKYDIAVVKMNMDIHPDLQHIHTKPAIFNYKEVSDIEASIWKTVLTMDKQLYLTNDFDMYHFKIETTGKCFEYYGVEIQEDLICVDLTGHDVCFVNEFGPIFYMDKVVGVLAVKPRDCDTRLAVFTNISFYTGWISKSTHSTPYG